jgi:hypothetical protein
MARDRDELLARARAEADRILAEAREQRDRLLSRSEIIHVSEREAARIIDNSKERGAKLRAEAEDYIDQKLAAFEILLNKTLQTVARGREQLQGNGSSAVVSHLSAERASAGGPLESPELDQSAL